MLRRGLVLDLSVAFGTLIHTFGREGGEVEKELRAVDFGAEGSLWRRNDARQEFEEICV